MHKRDKKRKAKADAWCLPRIKEFIELISIKRNVDLAETKLEEYNKQWNEWVVARAKDYPIKEWSDYFCRTTSEIMDRMKNNIEK